MRLVAKGYDSYPEYLRSAHWARVRALYWNSEEPKDCICGETDGLQLHHMTYDRVGAEDLSDLTPLCPTCHAMIHALEQRGDIGLDFRGFVSDKRAERYRPQLEAVEEKKAEYRATKHEERSRAAVRSITARLREGLLAAVRDGRDMSDAIADVDRVIVILAEQKKAA